VIPLFNIITWKLNGFVDLVEWAIALHGMYESSFNFNFNLKQKNLYIVGCVVMHLGHNRIFPADRIRILPQKINRYSCTFDYWK